MTSAWCWPDMVFGVLPRELFFVSLDQRLFFLMLSESLKYYSANRASCPMPFIRHIPEVWYISGYPKRVPHPPPFQTLRTRAFLRSIANNHQIGPVFKFKGNQSPVTANGPWEPHLILHWPLQHQGAVPYIDCCLSFRTFKLRGTEEYQYWIKKKGNPTSLLDEDGTATIKCGSEQMTL